jgi:hypothetical protein
MELISRVCAVMIVTGRGAKLGLDLNLFYILYFVLDQALRYIFRPEESAKTQNTPMDKEYFKSARDFSVMVCNCVW